MSRFAPVVARVVLGLIFTAAGVAGLLGLAPPPENLPPDLKVFMDGLLAARYFFPLLKSTEVVCGLMLVSGFFVPLALVVLAPVVLNIVLVHLLLAPDGLVVALLIAMVYVYLAFVAAPYRSVLRPLLRARV